MISLVRHLMNPWVFLAVAIICAFVVYSGDRRDNPTAPRTLLAIRAIAFLTWLGAYPIVAVLAARWPSAVRHVYAASLFRLGLGIGLAASIAVLILKRRYKASLKPAQIIPDPVYVDGGPETWPPAPSTKD